MLGKDTKKQNATEALSPEDEKARESVKAIAGEDDAAVPPEVEAQLRGYWYRDSYRKAMTILGGSVLLNTVLVLGLLFTVFSKADPRYFAVTDDLRVIELTPVGKRLVTDAGLRGWFERSIGEIYSYNFADWRKQLQGMKPLFTTRGYRSYIKALKDSGNLDLVRANKYVVAAVSRQPAVVVKEGTVSGRYTWTVELPIRVVYESASDRKTQDLLVRATVVRVPEVHASAGLAIDQIVTRIGGG